MSDQFLRAAGVAERVFFRPPAGPVEVSCADDHSRNIDVQLIVTEQ